MTIQQLSGELSKGRDGWESQSDYQVPDRKERLRIHTYKSSRGGIQTVASCHRRNSDNTGETFVMLQDYREVAGRFPKLRCTEKTVKECHAVSEGYLTDIMAKALAHYAALDAKGVVAPD